MFPKSNYSVIQQLDMKNSISDKTGHKHNMMITKQQIKNLQFLECKYNTQY